MSNVTWGGADPYEVEKPLRSKIRRELDGPELGLVVTDIDLMVRRYTSADGLGTFKLVELKYGDTILPYGQYYGFKLMHELWREADPDGLKYKGFYVVSYTNHEWDNDEDEVTVTRFFDLPQTTTKMTVKEFMVWLDTT